MKALFLSIFVVTTSAMAADVRIKQVDKYGNVRHDLPQKIVKGDKIYQADKFGTIRYDLPHQVIKGDRIYQADKFGSIRYDLPSQKIVK